MTEMLSFSFLHFVSIPFLKIDVILSLLNLLEAVVGIEGILHPLLGISVISHFIFFRPLLNAICS